MAQDDYYYEIQLTNKQLVFYFMAGATGLILSFLAGVMVGRGVDTGAGEVQASRPVAEERVVSEEGPKAAAPPSPADLTYAQRLESEKSDDSLDRSKGASAPAPASKGTGDKPTRTASAASAPAASAPNAAAPNASFPGLAASKPSTAQAPAPKPAAPAAATQAAPKPAPPSVSEPKPAAAAPSAKVAASKPASDTPAASSATDASGKGFTVQVGAFKDKATADSVVTRLKGKGYAAYVMSPGATEGGLFVVRVGSYPQRGDAERTEAKLRDQEKFRPYIVKN